MNKDWIFSFKKYTLIGSDFYLEEYIGLRNSEVKFLLSNRKFIRSTCFLMWFLLQFSLVDRKLIDGRIFILNWIHTKFFSKFVSLQNSYHFPIFLSRFPTLLNMIFSVSNNNIIFSLEFGPDTVSLDMQNFADEAVLNSIEIHIAVWNLLESQRLRFLEDAISVAPLTEDEQAKRFEVHEQANVPNLPANHAMRQDILRGWEGQEIVIDKGSITD